MPRVCTVCQRPDRPEIDRAIAMLREAREREAAPRLKALGPGKQGEA